MKIAGAIDAHTCEESNYGAIFEIPWWHFRSAKIQVKRPFLSGRSFRRGIKTIRRAKVWRGIKKISRESCVLPKVKRKTHQQHHRRKTKKNQKLRRKRGP